MGGGGGGRGWGVGSKLVEGNSFVGHLIKGTTSLN